MAEERVFRSGFAVEAANISPAKGTLNAIGVPKYAWTIDERPAEFQAMLSGFAGCLKAPVTLKPDLNTNYPKWIAAVVPHAKLERVKGRSKRQPAGTPKAYDDLFAN